MLPKLITFSMAGAGASMSAFNLLVQAIKRFPNDAFYYVTDEQNPNALFHELVVKYGREHMEELGNRVNIMQAYRSKAIAEALDISLANYPDMHHHFFLDTPSLLKVVVEDNGPDVQLDEPDENAFFNLMLAKNPKVTVDVATLRMSPKGLAAFATEVKRTVK